MVGEGVNTIVNTVRMVLSNVDSTIDRLVGVLETGLEYMESFLEKLEGGVAIILEKATAITEVVDSVTRSLFYAHRSNNNIFENAMNGVVGVLGASMDVIVPIVTGLNGALDVVDGVFDQIYQFIKVPFDTFEPAFDEGKRQLETIDWLANIMEEDIDVCFPYWLWGLQHHCTKIIIQNFIDIFKSILDAFSWLSIGVSVLFIISYHG